MYNRDGQWAEAMRWHEAIPEPVLVTADGEWHLRHGPGRAALLPGAFDPVHAGHWGLAAAAAELLGRDIAFELSVRNVDKPELDADEVERRLAPFLGKAPVWLTRSARFTEKVALFPESVFVVGADTAVRVVDPRYYGNDPQCMRAALDAIREAGCSFLVAARRGADGVLMTAADLVIPAGFERLFAAIPVECFRLDLSSTELRRGGRASAT